MATNTSKYLLKKPAYSDTADIGDINDNMDSIDSILFDHAGSIAVICMGNVCAVSVSTGQYVLLQKSTITGRTDGLYTAAKAIPANTVIDSSYLTAVSGGIANALNSNIQSLKVKINELPLSQSNIGAPDNGFVVIRGGTNGTTLSIGADAFAIGANQYGTFYVTTGRVMRYSGGPYSGASFFYFTIE